MGIELVVGLGNPGDQYRGTRHNCGFMVLDRLAQRWSLPLKSEARFQGLYGEGRGAQQKIRLLEPHTYMNVSGRSVQAVVSWYKLDPTAILVVYDDMALPFGRLRLREQGSAGGHNGIKSLIQHLGTQDFPRLRVGVGAPKGAQNVTNHVLGKFAPWEQIHLEKVLNTAADAVELTLRQGIKESMNRYNPVELVPAPPSPELPTQVPKIGE